EAVPRLRPTRRPQVECAQPVQQLVHQDDQELSLRAKVRVERSGSRPGAGGDLSDRRGVVALLREERAAGVQELSSFLETTLLLGRRRRRLPRPQGRGARAGRHGARQTPATAPPQQISIHPPNNPATAGSRLGNTAVKKTQESGSSIRVGSINS